MKTFILSVTLLAFLVLNAHGVEAQASGIYYYDHYQQYSQHQQNDPYYELHVMHYRLYLQRYQPHQLYPPCCYVVVTVPQIRPPNTPRQTRASAQTQVAVTPLPQAVSPLPQAVAPLPRAAGQLPNITSRR